MDTLKNRKNWRIETFSHECFDGTRRDVTVIVVSEKELEHPAFGRAPYKQAFELCVGRRCVGMFGSNPVIVGTVDDRWFRGWSFFDGLWSTTDSDVLETSGSGRLYEALTSFTDANRLAQ